MGLKNQTTRIRNTGHFVEYGEVLADGQVASDGYQYTSVATFGTTAVEVFNKIIDPGGLQIQLKELQVQVDQRFNNLKATSVGSLIYYWRARSRAIGTFRSWVNFTGTLSTYVATSGVSTDPLTTSYSGYLSVASIPEAPLELSLTAVGLVASSLTGEVKNTSYVEFLGVVIPGT